MLNNDAKTTLLGAAAAATLVANLDWTKLFAHDPGEISKAAGAVIVTLFGLFTNKPDPKK